jgi:hypothetical protein
MTYSTIIPAHTDDHTTSHWLHLVKPNIFREGTMVIRDREHCLNTVLPPQVRSPLTPKLYHRHDRLHRLSITTITISTPLYFLIIDFTTIRGIVRLLLFIYSKILNTMVLIVDPILYELSSRAEA